MTIALMSACKHCAQETIDRTLVMIQNADPTGETAADPPELSALEGSALTSIVTASHYSASDRGAEYCDERVCVCFLFTIISSEPHVRSSPNFVCLLPMAVARSSSVGVVIHYVLPDDVIFAHKPRLLDVSTQLKHSAHIIEVFLC